MDDCCQLHIWRNDLVQPFLENYFALNTFLLGKSGS